MDFVNELENLLKTAHVRDMLKFMSITNCDYYGKCNEKYNGWEKWFQFELAKYLSKYDCKTDWEKSFCIDGRTKTPKSTNRLDLIYRVRNHSSEYFVGVELKVNVFPQYAIKELIKDLCNIGYIKLSDWNLRSVIGVAFYSDYIMKNTKDYSKYKQFVENLKKAGKINIIRICGWHCFVIKWEASNLNDYKNTRTQYKKYMGKFSEIAKKHNIEPI